MGDFLGDLKKGINKSVEDLNKSVKTLEIQSKISSLKKEADTGIEHLKEAHDAHVSNLKDALADFKLHVARNYVSVNYLKDVENRLTDHLLRIEKKLDGVGRNS